jgi:hypothetical protein
MFFPNPSMSRLVMAINFALWEVLFLEQLVLKYARSSGLGVCVLVTLCVWVIHGDTIQTRVCIFLSSRSSLPPLCVCY